MKDDNIKNGVFQCSDWNITIDLNKRKWIDSRGEFYLIRINKFAYQVIFDKSEINSNYVIVWNGNNWIEFGVNGKKNYKKIYHS